MKNRKHVNHEKIVSALELPKDLLLGMPYLTMNGNRELLIENHRGILTYTGRQMVILTKTHQIEISGSELYVEYYTADLMKIRGNIDGIAFRS